MEISVDRRGSVTVVSLAGDADANYADSITRALLEQISAQTRWVVVDLSAVDFMSSAGLRSLLTAYKETQKVEGDMTLAAPQEGVRSVLNISGFDKIMTVYDDTDAAVMSFSG